MAGTKYQQSNKLMMLLSASVIILLHLACPVFSLGAMSVDLGSEWMKVGVVAPGIMDIALSLEGERKVPMAVSISNGNTQTGFIALKTASRYPDKVFTHFLDLIGKPIDHEAVSRYRQRFPYSNITQIEDENVKSIVLNHPDGIIITPVELVTHMLKHAYNQVASYHSSKDPITDIVISIPPFFGWDERKAIRQAAKAAGLRVLNLIHQNSAFAYNYGIYRHTDYTTTNHTVLFFEQGASQTSITAADYHLSNNDTLPTITVREEVYDRFLGGFDMELKLRDYLVDKFSEKTGISKDKVIAKPRSMFKLLQEAKRIKKVLSANNNHNARVENVIDDADFLMPITRKEYEKVCDDEFNRVKNLLKTIPSSGEQPQLIIVVGGNTRTPKIQQVIQDQYGNIQIGKYINADEGAAVAALYQAAGLTPGFKVKQYSLNEYPREVDPEEILPEPVENILDTILGSFTNPNSTLFSNETFVLNTTQIDLNDTIQLPTIPVNISEVPTSLPPSQEQLTPSSSRESTTPGVVDQVTPPPLQEETPHQEL